MQALLTGLLNKSIRLAANGSGELKVTAGAEPLTDDEKNALKQQKPALLDFLAGGKAACLSYSQERLWFLAQMGYGAHYHVPGIAKLEGELNVEALAKAFNYLFARHASLRTHFIEIDGTPVQLVRAEVECNITVLI
ncbi:hypothetical protein VZ94_10375 [Methylocucumis oryzae]|uniref:Condensation domain-containing protein n=1 Tax=Methylocucumis oryzae TaxID=1632867 RepID=A0A0F3ILZ6_9GAMM|nr:hypothetical protein VZ94_10375 [Methylocucumis oryzae]